MMIRKLTIALLLAASTAAAQTPREIFPSDYTPQPCTEATSCESFVDVDFPSAAFKFLLRDLRPDWMAAHNDEMLAMVQPYCVKRASCITMAANQWWFCNDVFAQELRSWCDRKNTPKTEEWGQCITWVDTYSAGVDQHGSADWRKAQACMKALPAPPATSHKLEWWSVPAVIPADWGAKDIRIYTIDAQTHIPVMAEFKVQDQIIYTADVPSGLPTSGYAWKWKRKLIRVPNAQGHTDVVAPTITISAAGYDPIVMPMPTAITNVKASIAPEKLHAGANKVTVTVTDASTGKPVEGQVYLGTQTVGFANQPFELKLPAGKHPDVWVRSPYGDYSDVVVAPAR